LQRSNDVRNRALDALALGIAASYIRAMQRRLAIIATTTPSGPRGFFGVRIFD